ncbi:hypothetical protein RvY_01999 [Ramazzottius varieornatus]|uniref:Uncharacterized protein n=1 Tax=Ramazzottius varieornatus TaxID=947166 RepID=A0A1D1ULM7_RAMVA|nr:hypothetical protein RvY_01999 [Ramazzottius varieornatus]
MTAYSFAEAVDCIALHHGIHLENFYLHPNSRSFIAVVETPWSPTPFRGSNSSCCDVCTRNSCALKVYQSMKSGMIPKAVQPGARTIIPCTDCSYIRGWKASKTTVLRLRPSTFDLFGTQDVMFGTTSLPYSMGNSLRTALLLDKTTKDRFRAAKSAPSTHAPKWCTRT